ncbi:MAG TPA: orotidine 5'-phosphate decarboxylase / HUMPS family protein [Candidatus Nanoarchaeia archaeon]|nr:orotidine 5'-phosphate decarboxylase / HUMPS family protein [Candidatus Nanoarchaeia archaeon]
MDRKTRYLQIAFNYDLASVNSILPTIPFDDRILIEAGTPFIKREGANGINRIAQLWKGKVVADLKTMDGAAAEVAMAFHAGATAATVLGSATTETIDLFIKACKSIGMVSMIDMIGVEEPLKVLMRLKQPPDVVVLHKGRDEETTRGKVIKYKHINKVNSKFDVLISAAGGVDLKEARSAIFNGANIVVVNIVADEDPWAGISLNDDVAEIAKQFLETIE